MQPPDNSPLINESSGGWSRTTRYLVLVLLLAALIWLITTIQALLGPLVIASLLAYIMNPAIGFMSRHTRIKRAVVVPLIYIIGLVLIATVLALLVPTVVVQVDILTEELQSIPARVDSLVASEPSVLGFTIPLQDFWDQFKTTLQEPAIAPGGVLILVQNISQNIVWVLVILVTTFYLLLDWARLRDWLFGIAPDEYQPDVFKLYDQVKNIWRAYLRGQLVLSIVIGVLSGVGSAAVGLRGAAALGLLAGVADFIPSAGPVVAMAVATIVAFFEGSSHLDVSNGLFALIVLGIYILIQTFENIWLRPRIMGYSLKLHPGIVFVAVMGSLAMAGILVTLLIIPIIGTVGVLGHYLRCRILGLDPWADKILMEPVATIVAEEHLESSKLETRNPKQAAPRKL